MDNDDVLGGFLSVAEPAQVRIDAAKDPSSTLTRKQKDQEITLAYKSFEAARDAALEAAAAVRSEALQAANIEWNQDPTDPSTTTAILLEADQMSRNMTKVEAQNKLIPRALELLSVGQDVRAEVYARAANLTGANTSKLFEAIEEQRNLKFPNRISASAKANTAIHAHTRVWVALQLASAQMAAKAGRWDTAASHAIAVKLADSKAAKAEKRPIKGAQELGLPIADNGFHVGAPENGGSFTPGQSRMRGVATLTKVDSEGRAI